MDRWKKNSGAKRMREQGYVRVDLWFPPMWADWLKAAAIRYELPVATLCRFLSLSGVTDCHERHDIAESLTGKERAIWEAIEWDMPTLPGINEVEEETRQRGKPSRTE